MAGPSPFALEHDAGERLAVGNATILVRASGASTGGAFSLFEEVPPLVDTPLHVHEREHELDGFFRTLADAERAGALGPEAYASASSEYGITWLG